jgi:hypothetical protein
MMQTSAQKYLRELLEQYPLPDLPADRTDAVIGELGALANGLDLDLSQRVPDLLSELHDLLPPIAQQMLRDGHLVVGEIGADQPNAHVKKLEDGQFAVVLHSGLFAFLYRIARPLASAVFRPAPGAGSGIAFPELARIIAEIIWWIQCTGDSFGPEYEVTFEQKHLASFIATGAERFLLAHELGHVLFSAGAMPEGDLSTRLDDSMEEHVADVTALDLSLQACIARHGESDPTWLMLAYAGAELALQIWGVMERIGYDFVDGVHPPASQRIAVLRRVLRERCETDKVFETIAMAAKVIERAFNEVSQIIVQPGDHGETFTTEADSLVEEFERLLEKCSKERIPDYLTFYGEAPALLSRGYPEWVLHKVFFTIAARFKEVMSQEPEDRDKAQAIKRFTQFKLLRGLTQHMPEPARSLYDAALASIKG